MRLLHHFITAGYNRDVIGDGGEAVDINRYRYVATLARTCNFTKAAEELHISQPALTKAVKKTEEEIGTPLFDRETSPIRLTYAGESFLKEAIKILNVQDTLEKEMNRIVTGRKGKVVVGVPVESASGWLPRILPDFAEKYPDIEIGIVEGNSDSFERELLRGTVDFCIYTLPVHSKDLDYEIVNEHPIYLVTSARHPFAKGADLARNSPYRPRYLDPQKLNGEKLLTMTPDRGMYRTDRGMYRITMQILERHGIRAEVALQLTNNYTISSLAAAGFGVCFCSLPTCERLESARDLNPVFHSLEDPVFTRKTIIAYRRGNSLSEAAENMVNMVRARISGTTRRDIVVDHG